MHSVSYTSAPQVDFIERFSLLLEIERRREGYGNRGAIITLTNV